MARRHKQTGQWLAVAAAFGVALLVSANAAAGTGDTSANVKKRIRSFLHQQNVAAPGHVSVTVHSNPASDAPCRDPQPSLTGAGHRTTGRLTIVVICHNNRPRRRYYQADVAVNADYWTAARNLAAGHRITAPMLDRSNGEITHLRGPLVFDRSRIVGQVARRRIAKGTPINKRMLEPPKAVHRGQSVEIVVRGSGFAITTQGTALQDAEKNKNVRVRTDQGQVVTGVAQADGRVVVHD